MASGWALAVGIAALFLVAVSVGLVVRARASARGSVTASALDGLFALGPTLVALGLVFGDDRAVGYTFIGAGVVSAVIVAVARGRRTPG